LILLVPLLLLWTALVIGEALPPAYVLSLPNSTSGVYQPIWDRQQQVTYKLQAEIQRAPEVLLLGTSRGLFMRSEMFTRQPEAFYNGVIPANRLGELAQTVAFLGSRDALPDVLLLQLDLPEFNGDRTSWRVGEVPELVPPSWTMNVEQISLGLYEVGRGWVTEPGWMLELMTYNLRSDAPLRGRAAPRFGESYRIDGSRDMQTLTPEFIAEGLRRHERLLEQRRGVYEVGEALDADSLAHVEHILDVCREHEVAVIGFLLPFRHGFYQEMWSSEDFAYLTAAQQQIRQRFDAHGYALWDFSDPARIGSVPEDFYDGWHGGERLMMRVVRGLALAEADALSAYVDLAALEADISRADDPFFYYVPRR